MRQRITLVIELTSCVVLLLACTAMFAFQAWSIRENFVSQLTVMGEIAANNVAEAAMSRDERRATQTLAGLHAMPQVVSATLASVDGQMQLGVFAAPRNEGIWDDVRAEISQSLASQGGSATDEPDGPFGIELRGTLKGPDGSMPVRFVGVDGPRWFLRAMLVGPIAVSATKAAPFEDALRAIVVVRGSEPLPVREPVPLELPKEAADQLGTGQASPADS
jgi:hypothetical protein